MRKSSLFAVAAVVAVVVAATGGGVASAHSAAWNLRHGSYLALGDSVAFGYVPPQAVPAPNYSDADSFRGYPEFVGKRLEDRVSNASCPGETTASLLTAGAQSNGCENALNSPVGYRTFYPLHVGYTGTQMDYALHFLATHPRSTRLVSINIGANDAFLCQQTTNDGCVSELPGLLATIATNLGTMLTDIRSTGYQGPIVVLTYYSLNYSDPVQTALTGYLDQAISGTTQAYGGIVADGFGAFQAASTSYGGDPCAAGLLIPLPGGGCNIHPSVAGQELLAKAIVSALP